MWTESTEDTSRSLTRPMTVIGIGLMVLGALSIAAPQQSGMTVGVLVGIFLVFAGLLRTALRDEAGRRPRRAASGSSAGVAVSSLRTTPHRSETEWGPKTRDRALPNHQSFRESPWLTRPS